MLIYGEELRTLLICSVEQPPKFWLLPANDIHVDSGIPSSVSARPQRGPKGGWNQDPLITLSFLDAAPSRGLDPMSQVTSTRQFSVIMRHL